MFNCTTAQPIYCTNIVKLYSQQLISTYTNYTEDAATCSAVQQLSTFTVKILYKLCSLQLICTYSKYTEDLQHVQLHDTTARLFYNFCKKLYSLQLDCT